MYTHNYIHTLHTDVYLLIYTVYVLLENANVCVFVMFVYARNPTFSHQPNSRKSTFESTHLGKAKAWWWRQCKKIDRFAMNRRHQLMVWLTVLDVQALCFSPNPIWTKERASIQEDGTPQQQISWRRLALRATSARWNSASMGACLIWTRETTHFWGLPN